MATRMAIDLKRKWAKMPDEYFEPDTFGDLKIGEKFISLPFPGDNRGHDGFKGTYIVYRKTSLIVERGCINAKMANIRLSFHFPRDLLVVRVK